MGKTTTCISTTDPNCATAHSGNRYGSKFPQLKSDYVWCTAPGWGSVITGVSNQKHGVKSNDNDHQAVFSKTVKNNPTMFSQVRELGKVIAASGAPNFLSAGTDYGVVDYECGVQEGKDIPIVNPSDNTSCNLHYRAGQSSDNIQRDKKTTDFGIHHIKDPEQCADLIMLHYDLIDHAGHTFTFSWNPFYLYAMSTADEQFGKLLDEVVNRVQNNDEEWLITVTADHGGYLWQHGVTLNDDEVVPFIVSVVGNKQRQIKDLVNPVKHYDISPTVLKWFGIPTDIYNIDGKAQGI